MICNCNRAMFAAARIYTTWLVIFGAVNDAHSCGENGNAIVKENCKTGTSSRHWDINGSGDPEIQGFATKFGVSPGETVRFKVKTVSDKYRIDIFRLGYYGGLGARKVGTVEPFVKLPQIQPECFTDKATLLYDCGTWEPSAEYNVPSDATSGVYVARLTREDSIPPLQPGAAWRSDYSQLGPEAKFCRPGMDTAPSDPDELIHSYGQQKRSRGENNLRNALHEPRASHIYFVVRSLESDSEVLFQTSDTTWQAYNRYGGSSTYGSYKPAAPRPRCFESSYNRPIENRDYRAINLIFGAEYPAIRFLERNGYDVSYWSGIDTYLHGAKYLKKHKVFLSVGHDEYWSSQQRKNVERARDQDNVHLMFWSGNEVFWKIRWENSKVGEQGEEPRTMVCYKETQEIRKIDPNPDMWTGTFRDSRPINPEGTDPENSLTGQLFTVNAWRNDALIVPRRFARLPIWRNARSVERLLTVDPFVPVNTVTYLGTQPVINSTWVEPWAILKQGVLGHEWDEDIDNGYRPAGMIQMSETTVDNVAYIQDSGSSYDSGSATHHLTLYRANACEQDDQVCKGSDALVFGAGTVQWTWGLDVVHDDANGLISQTENGYNTRLGIDLVGPDRAIQQATINLFAMMGNIQPQTLETGLKPGHPLEADKTFSNWRCEVLNCAFTDDSGVTIDMQVHTKNDGIVAFAEIQIDGVWHPSRPNLEAYIGETNEDPSFGRYWTFTTKGTHCENIYCRFSSDSLQLSNKFGPFLIKKT